MSTFAEEQQETLTNLVFDNATSVSRLLAFAEGAAQVGQDAEFGLGEVVRQTVVNVAHAQVMLRRWSQAQLDCFLESLEKVA